MEVHSPPKRITRARAAKATTEPTVRTSRLLAASAKPATSTTRTVSSMKRKTRPDEAEDEEESHPTSVASTTNAVVTKSARPRGRPRKVVEPEPETEPESEAEAMLSSKDGSSGAPRATRGRAKKPATESTKAEQPKISRTRTKKVPSEEETIEATVPVKRATRGRPPTKTAGTICTEATTNPTPGLKSAVSRPASRLGTVKKSVTFQEPEKENLVPAASKKAKSSAVESATGMRAKPVRKAVAGVRSTRATTKTSTSEDKKDKAIPLSPKKDGPNRPLSRGSNSDDELAGYDSTPVKPLMKSPVKPSTMRRLDFGGSIHDHAEPADELRQVDELTATFTSPVKRPPSSPIKDTLKSPAKRAEGVPTLLFASTKSSVEVAQSPLKASMLQSPAKRPQIPLVSFQAPSTEASTQIRSPSKMSLLHSPAKRPVSSFRVHGSSTRSTEEDTISLSITRSATRVEATDPKPARDAALDLSPKAEQKSNAEFGDVIDRAGLENDVEMSDDNEEDAPLDSPTQLEFPGRMSAVLPRHADPALQDKSSPLAPVAPTARVVADEQKPVDDEDSIEESEIVVALDDPMDVDAEHQEDAEAPLVATAAEVAVSPPLNPMFGLRQKDLVPCETYESEDELAMSGRTLSKFRDDSTLTFTAVPATPTPGACKTPRSGLPSSAIKNAGRAIRSVTRGPKLGFTPLARQLGEWRASSPLKLGPESPEDISQFESDESIIVADSPSKGSFFEDEMEIRTDLDAESESDAHAAMIAALEADLAANFDDPVFGHVHITAEDVELAAEANEMSLLESQPVQEPTYSHAHDDATSEASQEYGDENTVPIDPALLSGTSQAPHRAVIDVPPITPVRPSTARAFNTTTKVPLKPADDSPPKSMKRRSASVSRVPVKRPAVLSRNATVISYSPTKDSSSGVQSVPPTEQVAEQPPTTPAKSDIWSSIGTPARTPRRDMNPALLRGAVVFVDVHTSEGADASTVFVELLTQMGARCVKSWPWNPTSPVNGESSTSKIGITHVVYKDGGKRTMEKVRESGGVVQCVGVGWVLDCERENEWLDEAPYYIDTSLVPRGGARRRKSMEPKALANLNGTLVTPMKQTTTLPRDCQTVPNNHVNRRDSTIWVRSPSNHGDDDEDHDAAGEDDWEAAGLLTPVPKTPAPEAVHRYVEELVPTPETPNSAWTHDSASSEKEEMLMRTAPPKQSLYTDFGSGLLSQQKDQSVMMRLMAARRKSLQFAPKIASPLSKAWN
ncbi:hypothetical protein BX600DRAFT_544737 [Xylariales sp. PMI_506]|nr:hypothetical protein BX600DRAFT_544737 [Xylariales sp. PMI_506]